jgi:hypothetical protein
MTMREDVERGGDEPREAVQTRVGIGQSLARDQNERYKASRPSSIFSEYGCECATSTCERLVSLTVDEYEQVRSVPTHFVVARGHLDPRVEFVVRESSRYQVVEKFGVAADVATRLDPQPQRGRHRKLGS